MALGRRGRETEQQLRDLRAELGGMRQSVARLEEAEEQARIALELYDGIAHSLHTIARDAANAEQPQIVATTDEALGELDRLRGMLRGDQDEETERSLMAVATLVDRAREGGMPVTLHVEGAPRRIPRSLDQGAFRIVQEALRNVHKHANGEPASVRVSWRDDAVAVQVRNSGRIVDVNRDGRGMTIMRERVAFHGGDLRAGALPAGGYEVTALLPL
jgi:signal transduction histidine kinase